LIKAHTHCHTKQADLVGILGTDETVSKIVSGKQEINQAQAFILADLFKVSPDLFISH
jgi:plasmid maintenance system antidote protein VapI